MGGGGGDNETYSKYKPYQQADFSRYLGQVWDQWNAGGDGFYDPNYAGGEQTYAGWSPEQEALFSELTGQGGALSQAVGQLESTLGPYDPNRTGVQAAIDAAQRDIYRNLNEQTLVAGDQSATNVGQFGSSRHGIAEGLATRGAHDAAGDIAANMYYQDQQQFLQNQQNALQNFGAITQGLFTPGGMQQADRQGAMDDQFNRWQYESNVGLQDLTALRDLLNINMGGEQWGEGSSGNK